jgi:hypothetical protein
MNNEPVSIVTLLVAILTFVTSKEVAGLLGPYAAIAVSASAGAALSLSSTEKDMPKWWNWSFYIMARIGVALVLTGSISQIAASQFPDLKPSFMLVPIAFGLGYLKDYRATLSWCGTAIKKVLPGWLAGLGNKDVGK